jgi:hypothetical protein
MNLSAGSTAVGPARPTALMGLHVTATAHATANARAFEALHTMAAYILSPNSARTNVKKNARAKKVNS